MTEKYASVHWQGSGKTGRGLVSTETAALKRYPYGFVSRFDDDWRGTNPEELLAAAHAACFAMAFSFACEKAGFPTTSVDAQAQVHLTAKDGGFVIEHIALRLRATVPGLADGRFQALARATKQDCPVSRALAGVHQISLEATLVEVALVPAFERFQIPGSTLRSLSGSSGMSAGTGPSSGSTGSEPGSDRSGGSVGR